MLSSFEVDESGMCSVQGLRESCQLIALLRPLFYLVAATMKANTYPGSLLLLQMSMLESDDERAHNCAGPTSRIADPRGLRHMDTWNWYHVDSLERPSILLKICP